ncbi:MAG: hypothetical protein IIZ67_05425 [Bacilli bacterium]|nr:hypothetical protein [Bacilli bacterium]
MKRFLKSFRIEILTTILFIELFILSVYYVGVDSVLGVLFNLVVLLEIPVCYFGTRKVRKLLYDVFYGEVEYED